MQIKKSKEANLERKRFRFFQVGLILSVSSSLLAFEWLTPDKIVKKATVMETPYPEVIFVPELPKNEEQKMQENAQTAPVHIIEEVKVIPDNRIEGETEHENVIDDNFDFGFIPGPESGGGGPVVVVTEVPVVEAHEVDKMPQFDYIPFLNKHLNYPWPSKNQGHSGTVYVSFVVTEDGKVTGVKFLQATGSADEDMVKEALRVISMMPAWTPGEFAGLPVRVRMSLPIKFVLH
jgi:periplasmic protein TonB